MKVMSRQLEIILFLLSFFLTCCLVVLIPQYPNTTTTKTQPSGKRVAPTSFIMKVTLEKQSISIIRFMPTQLKFASNAW